MKKFILHFCILAAILTYHSGAQTYSWMDWSSHMPEQVGFSDVHFIGNKGWITGGNGKIYYTTDGGETFTIQILPAPAGISNSVFIRSINEGYVVTSTGRVFYASNPVSGNWTLVSGSPSVALFSIHFPPAGMGYTCGNSGRIYSVTSSSVVLDATFTGVTFTSIVFPVSTQGWVCGGTTIRHKNGTWLDDQFYYAGDSYNAIFFVDNMNGWAVGGGGSPFRGKIIHTVDGINWNGQINQDTISGRGINDVYFINTQEGWSVGSFGLILHTTNSGVTWVLEGQNIVTSNYLRGVFAVDNHTVYVVGNNTFFKYSQTIGIKPISNEIPSEFKLFQNFPNPFNPGTKIRFSLPHPSEGGTNDISLIIYDVLGRQVASLIPPLRGGQEGLQPGTYEVEFDGSNYPSGVYFYTLQTESFNETRKMVLIK